MNLENAPQQQPAQEKPIDAAAEAREAFRKSVEILREKPVDLPRAETAAEVFAKAERIAFTARVTDMIKDGDIEGAIAAMEERNKTYPGKPKGSE